MNPIEHVRKRSDGRCEAMVLLSTGVWARCWSTPVEIHHMLTKARGGRILDEAGETYHLSALCNRCHRASDGLLAYQGDLLIEGYVTTVNGKPHYEGPDEYLRSKYGD